MSGKTTSALLAALLMSAYLGELASAQDLIWHWDGEAQDDEFGYDVCRVGDQDSDGVADVLIGAVEPNSRAGKVYLYSGGTGALLESFVGTTAGDLLFRVAALGDVDVDGVDDYILGAPGADYTGLDAGRAYVYSGKTRTVLFVLDEASDGLGWSLSGLGDLNHDGVPDIAVGAYKWTNVPGLKFTGRAYVYSGRDASMLYLFQGEAEWDEFSYSLARCADLNHDGHAEFLAAAPISSVPNPGQGRLYYLSGKDGSVLRTIDGQPYTVLGTALRACGDVDRDGVLDHIASAPGYGAGVGAAYVISGKTGTTLHSFLGDSDQPLGNFAYSVAGVGDVNGDDYPDLMVGATHYDNPGPDAGHAFLYSGRTGRLLYVFKGPGGRENLGWAIDGLGDVNGDGFGDIVITSLRHDGLYQDQGAADVFAGNDLWLEATRKKRPGLRQVTLDVRGGPPGGLAVVYTLDVGGASGPWFVNQGRLDTNGDWSFQVALPQSLWGYTLSFQAFATRALPYGGTAPWIDSAVATVDIQP